MSKLNAFIHRHGRPFTVRAKNGKGTTEVMFYDGYVVIRDTQPRTRHYLRDTKITRSAWVALLRASVPPTRLMEGPDFDANLAERVMAREELEHLEALRQEKRHRRQPKHLRRTRT